MRLVSLWGTAGHRSTFQDGGHVLYVSTMRRGIGQIWSRSQRSAGLPRDRQVDGRSLSESMQMEQHR